MKLRELYSQNTPRTILWRALFAVIVGLLGSTLVALFTGRSRFSELAVVAIGVPLTLATANLLVCWFAADTQRKLHEAGQIITEAALPNRAFQRTEAGGEPSSDLRA